MKTKHFLFIAIISLGLFTVSCSNSSQSKEAPQNDQLIKKDTSKTKAEAQANYVCPMGKECGYSDKPGKCPSCGSEMVAVNKTGK